MKGFPSYITLRYYYEDETYSSTYDYSKGSKVIGSILLTEDGQIYLNQQNGCTHFYRNLNSHPDLEEKRCIIPFEWVNNKQIEDCLRRQPYDFEGWSKSDSMYSKNFWRKVLSDIRDFKIKLSLNELKLDETKWIRN